MLTEESVWLPPGSEQLVYSRLIYWVVLKVTTEMSYRPISHQASFVYSLLSHEVMAGFICLQHILECHRGSNIWRNKPNTPESLL